MLEVIYVTRHGVRLLTVSLFIRKRIPDNNFYSFARIGS